MALMLLTHAVRWSLRRGLVAASVHPSWGVATAVVTLAVCTNEHICEVLRKGQL